MPKKNKTLCVDDLRHAEYYGMQPVFDELYHRSLEGENFTDLMDLILSRDNILLAYRNIKANGGSYTAGTDNKNISDIGCLPPETVAEKVRFIVTGSQHGYRPKPVRRKDIPKPNGKTRPLGIPCIWDRLVQQCIKQVIEPICEAKFSDNSYGFRPNRSVEHAVQKTYTMLQRMNLHYVIEFDIKGFFDNVNHSKLMRQIWAMGIHDKQLIFIIKRILKAPIRMPDGTTLIPDKGTPQGGIISPLLANIVLNELDKWVESQWQNHPLVKEYGYERKIRNSITFDRSKAFLKMRKTGLKEMYIVRYADDFRIFCRNKEDALRTKEAVTAWITERLRLEVSPEKTRIGQFTTLNAGTLHFRDNRQDRLGDLVIVDAAVTVGENGAGGAVKGTNHAAGVRGLLEPAIDVCHQQAGVLCPHPLIVGCRNLQLQSQLTVGILVQLERSVSDHEVKVLVDGGHLHSTRRGNVVLFDLGLPIKFNRQFLQTSSIFHRVTPFPGSTR